MTHLGPDELIDAIDGALSATRRGHLDTCERCRSEAAALHALMADVRASTIPEPSPLFWDQFSARVKRAISEEPPAPRARWFRWPVLAPVAALALIVLALVSAVADYPHSPAQGTAGPVHREAVMPVGDDQIDVEAPWAVVAELVGGLDVDAARDAGIATAPGVADSVILELSLGEQQELIRLLREELRAGS